MALPNRGGFRPGGFNRGRFAPRREAEHRINHHIRVPQVRLVGDNVTVGVYSTQEAMKIAQEQELDLVEISPQADPPVCKIIDYNKFLYDKKEGKWFRINNKGIFHPEFINSIPDNSTLEFDLGVNSDFQWANGYFVLEITHFEDRDQFSRGSQNPTLHFQFHPLTGENYTGSVRFKTEHTSAYMTNEAHIKKWDGKNNLFAHVAIWRQGQRMRMYVNGDKLFDLPRAFTASAKYTDVIFQAHDMATEKGDYYLIGNIRLAEGAPDTRNKLVTEGRFVTSGITFDVNSDKIKPDSYGVLKEIASVLKENSEMKITIIGHTDSDGDDAANLELSKKRAAAVKASLSSEFGIDESRMKTDGMGETKPFGDNKTTEGKAQNRRVEFVKM